METTKSSQLSLGIPVEILDKLDKQEENLDRMSILNQHTKGPDNNAVKGETVKEQIKAKKKRHPGSFCHLGSCPKDRRVLAGSQ